MGNNEKRHKGNEAVPVKRSEADKAFDPTNVAESKRAQWERQQQSKD